MYEVLKTIPLFSKLNEDHIQLLSKYFSYKTYRADSLVFKENEPGDTFYIILKGSIKIFVTKHGSEKILAILKNGNSFGELSLIDGQARSASAQTLEHTAFLIITREHFMEILHNHFDITQVILMEISQRLRDTNQQINDLAFLDPRTRVLKNLINLAQRLGKRQGDVITVNLPLNYEELSQLASVHKSQIRDVVREMTDRQILHLHNNSFELYLGRI